MGAVVCITHICDSASTLAMRAGAGACACLPLTFRSCQSTMFETHEDNMSGRANSSSSSAGKRRLDTVVDSAQAAQERANRANSRSVPSSSRDYGLDDVAARKRVTPARDSASSTPDAPSLKKTRARKASNISG